MSALPFRSAHAHALATSAFPCAPAVASKARASRRNTTRMAMQCCHQHLVERSNTISRPRKPLAPSGHDVLSAPPAPRQDLCVAIQLCLLCPLFYVVMRQMSRPKMPLLSATCRRTSKNLPLLQQGARADHGAGDDKHNAPLDNILRRAYREPPATTPPLISTRTAPRIALNRPRRPRRNVKPWIDRGPARIAGKATQRTGN
jgi:hypothetical protein